MLFGESEGAGKWGHDEAVAGERMGMGAGCTDESGSGMRAGVRWNSSASDVRALAFPFVDWNFESDCNPPNDPFDAGWIASSLFCARARVFGVAVMLVWFDFD